MFASTSRKENDGLRAFYNISLLIPKLGKSRPIEEQLILSAVEVLKIVLHQPTFDILKKNLYEQQHTQFKDIDEMSLNVESSL